MQINQIDDPRLIPQTDLPFHFILSNQTTDLIAWAINWKTKSNYDHVMQAINQGKFITQDFGGYHEVDMKTYLKKGGQLKFIRLKNANEQFDIAFRSSILNRLSRPWHEKLYDWFNIIGRAFGLNWLHMPGTFDCSEIALYICKQNSMYLPKEDSDLIMSLANTSSPNDIDECIKNNPDKFITYGIWSADEGVII